MVWVRQGAGRRDFGRRGRWLVGVAAVAAAVIAIACGDGVGVAIERIPEQAGTAGAGVAAGAAGAGAVLTPPLDAPFPYQPQRDHRDPSDDHEHQPAGELDVRYCADALDWPEMFASSEDELLGMINSARERGIRCGDRESDSLWPLQSSPELQCSARLHSLDMAVRGFTSETSPDGYDPRTRMDAAGFPVQQWSESIVTGETEPGRVLQRLLGNPSDCVSLQARELNAIGIGRHGELWTLDFASD
jgi:uncharacterized protein YkwD